MEKRFVRFLDNDNWNSNTLIGCLFKPPDMAYTYIRIRDNKYNCMSLMEIVTYGTYMYMHSALHNTITHI